MNAADILNAIGALPSVKIVHMAKLISSTGGVSPWCAKTPRRINLKKALWTNRWEAVTCARCVKAKANSDAL
jgi:hypothetical protein